METIYKGPTEGAVDAPVSVPMEKPDVPRNLTQAKESQAAKIASRRKRIEEVTISGDDKGIRSITKPNEDRAPVTPSYEKYAAKDGTLDERTAGRARAREANIKFGHEINAEIFQRKNFSDEEAQAHAEYVSGIGRKASQAKTDRHALVKDTGESLVPLDYDGSGETTSVRRHLKEHGEKELTLEDATRYMANARQAGELAKEQLLTQIRENVAAEEAQTEQARPAPAQPTADQQRVQAERAQQERARQAQIQAQRAQAARAQQEQAERDRMSVDEWRVHIAWENHLQQMAQIPEFADRSGRLWQETYAKDPLRFADLQKVAQAAEQYKAQAHNLRQQRLVREHQIGQARTAHQKQAVAQFVEAEDNRFSQWVENEMPEHSKGEGKKALQRAAREVLKSTGLTDQQISEQWQSGYLRPFGFQKVIAEAARWKLVQESMRNIQRAPTWEATVQKPGVGHRARSSDVDDIKSLQRKVSNSKGRAALMAAVELQKAQRRARGE